MERNHKPGIFYGYVIVVVSILLFFIIHGLSASYGVFFKSLQEDFGCSRTIISAAHSVAFILTGLVSIPAGRFTDSVGPRVVVAVGGITLALGYMLMSQTSATWQLFLVYGLIVGSSVSVANVPLLTTLAKWFIGRRGLMTGIVKTGTGLGILGMPLIASHLITSYGWRTAYLVLAAIALVGVLPLTQFLRRDPAQKGLKPYGTDESNSNISRLPLGGLTLSKAIHTRQYWTVAAICFLFWYCMHSVMVHLVPHAMDIGYSSVRAASIISVIGGVSILGRVVIAGSSDRIGSRRAMIICSLVLLTSLSLLYFTRELWQLYVFAAIYGFSHGGFAAMVSPLVAELFGTRFHGSLYGVITFFGTGGGAIGPLIAGRIFDVSASYQPAFLVLIIASIIALMLAISLKPVEIPEE